MGAAFGARTSWQSFGPASVKNREKTGRVVRRWARPDRFSGLDLKRDQEAVLLQRMKKPGAGFRPQAGYPACALIKKPISGKPEIGAHFANFYFPNRSIR
jgi:hypothetical protein